MPKIADYLIHAHGGWHYVAPGTARMDADYPEPVWAIVATGQVICRVGDEDLLVALRQFVPGNPRPDQVARRITDLLTANNRLETEARAGRALARGILALLGNVDHSRGGGENAARLYGGMLESIREMCGALIASHGNPETISPGNHTAVSSIEPTGGSEGHGTAPAS